MAQKTYLHIIKKDDSKLYRVVVSTFENPALGGQVLESGLTKSEAIALANDLSKRWDAKLVGEYDNEPKVIHTQFEEEEFEYADGGMMADGGRITKGSKYMGKFNTTSGDSGYSIYKIVDTDYFSNKYGGSPHTIRYEVIESSHEKVGSFDESSRKEIQTKLKYGMWTKLDHYADGGMMAKGGATSKIKRADKLRKEGARVTLSFDGNKGKLAIIKEHIENMWYFDEENFADYGNEIYFYDVEFRDAESVRDWANKKFNDVKVSISYNGKEYADGGMMADGGFFGFLSKNKLRVGDILLINADNLPPMRNGSQYFKVLPSTKLRVEKINNDTYSIRRVGIDEGSVENLNQYNKEDINTFLKEGKLIKEKMADGGMMAWGGKMAHGGKTHKSRHRKKTLEEKAMEAVGSDTWFQLDKETQAGVIAEMVSMGALPERMAKGAKVTESKDFTVEYELMDGKKVVEKYGSEEEMDDGIANFYIMNDVKDAIVGGKPEIVEEVKEVVTEAKPKRKSLFDVEKATPKVAKSKQTNPVAHIDGIEKEIQKYDELKAIIKNAEAEKEIIGGIIKDVAKDYYLDIYEKQGKRPTTITIESGGVEITYTIMDKYKTVTPEKETVLKEYGNLLGTDYTFTFDNEILDTQGNNGEKIGDIIDDLIQNSEDIPDDLKSKVVKITKKVGVKKGSIERLLAYDNPAEILQVIEAVEMLK